MLESFEAFMERNDLAGKTDKVLLAVSGGLDSMVMLDLFRKAGHRIAVAHCNFGLRGDASDGDEKFVKNYCKHARITFFSRQFETNNYATEHGLSVQMAARQLRYTWFDTLLQTEGFLAVATAHHLNDSLETVLLRLVKGGGLDQLTGIPVRNDRIIRPLLFATREEIEAYAKAEGITHREDGSNLTDDYARNFIRHRVVPLLKELNPGWECTGAVTLEKLRGATALMRRGLEQLQELLIRREEGTIYIDKRVLSILPEPAFVLYESLKMHGFDWSRCQQMVEALEGQPGKQFLSDTHRAVIDREYIMVSTVTAALGEILIEEGQDKAGLGRQMLILTVGGGQLSSEASEASLDMTKITFPLRWRKWARGDYFFPLGMHAKKKLSDFLIDRKVPLHEKDEVTVLLSGSDVVWVVGHRIDERYKVSPGTKKTLRVTLRHI